MKRTISFIVFALVYVITYKYLVDLDVENFSIVFLAGAIASTLQDAISGRYK